MSPSIDLVAGDSATHSTLSRGESIGLTIDTEAGLASVIAAFFILVLISRRIYRDQQYEAMDIYVIALFTAEVTIGLGHAISLKWVIQGESNAGTFCDLQGVLRQLGDVGVALATLAIAVQTFVTIWWLKSPKKFVAFISVGIQWTMSTLLVGIAYGVHTKPPREYYATPVPYWCWIGQDFKKDRLTGEYGWFWLTLFVSIILYFLLFLLDLGVIKPGRSWYAPTVLDHESDMHHMTSNVSSTRTRAAGLWTVIWYPIAYCVIVMPLSVVRWIAFKQIATYGKSNISPVATFTVATILGLSGVIDAVLYLLTRTWLSFPKGETSHRHLVLRSMRIKVLLRLVPHQPRVICMYCLPLKYRYS